MYTKECLMFHDDEWIICDPEGDFICTVRNEEEADALLSHLNRG